MTTQQILMPRLGEAVVEAVLTKWLKKEGDAVEEDEPIAEVATDKVDSEIPSPARGIIQQFLVEEGSTVPVGAPIAILVIEGDNVAPTTVIEKSAENTSQSNTSAPTSGSKDSFLVSHNDIEPLTWQQHSSEEKLFLSPLVKAMAEEHQITMAELRQIRGTGMHGRIIKEDILRYLQHRTEKPTEKPEETSHSADDDKSASSQQTRSDVEIITMSRMRKLIAEHMVRSKQTSPHVVSFIDVDMHNIVVQKEKYQQLFLEKHGTKLTYTHFFLHAVAQVLPNFPLLNASVDGDKIIIKKYINLGLATALPSGDLIVPVIKNAHMLNLIGISKAANELVQKARNNKLSPDDIADGTFSVTNLGTFQTLTGTPIIAQPQVAILAIGAIKKQVVVLETEQGDSIAIRPMSILSLSFDHRIIDGALGGEFLLALKRKLENYIIEL